MNISGLIRSFIGDTQAAEPKKLELKVGEVVKGLVLQLMADQDALINIGGVHVRAKLETPLKQGQVTMLQVQPETTASGQIVLKPLDSSGVQIADDSLGEVLKNVSIQDTPANRQMIQTLHQAGIPIAKDNVQAFTQFQAQLPAGALQQEELLPSAVVAFQKGLPLTTDTVLAVKQAIAGPALHETLLHLDSQIGKLLGGEHVLSDSTKAALDTVKQVVGMIRDASNQVLPQSVGNAEDLPAGADGQPMKGMSAAAGSTMSAAAQFVNQGSPSALQTGSALASASNPASVLGSSFMSQVQADAAGNAAAPNTDTLDSSGPSNQASTSRLPGQAVGAAASLDSSQAQDAAAEGQGTASTAANAASSRAASHPTGSPAASVLNDAPNSGPPEAAHELTGAAGPNGAKQPEASSNEHWLSKMMKALGVEHEHHIGKLPDKMVQNAQEHEFGLQGPQDSRTASTEEQQKSAETLKSALMQLMQAEDVPSAFKESAQQAVQQITGQQLLLNSDRTSMFSHITLFVPLMNANGEQTAAVHIQSRKGARGEIDAQNCRLVFDLRMKSLGDTMVDVQVVDRIVSLRVLNDQPFIQQLLESNREEIAAGLSGIGYQFISIKCGPYPEKGQDSQGAPAEASGNKQEHSVSAQLQAAYGKKTYKGMDVRV